MAAFQKRALRCAWFWGYMTARTLARHKAGWRKKNEKKNRMQHPCHGLRLRHDVSQFSVQIVWGGKTHGFNLCGRHKARCTFLVSPNLALF